MIKQKKGGSIILISSTGSLVGFNGLAAYGASKGGVDQLCRQLAVEWGPHNIRVNCVNPGYTTHNMRGTDARHAQAEVEDEMRRMTPMKRRGTPEEMAAPVVFLASPAASFISGVVIPSTAATARCEEGRITAETQRRREVESTASPLPCAGFLAVEFLCLRHDRDLCLLDFLCVSAVILPWDPS
jgi:NAD(P)-dependent dehydrogenase (short-subunit alcohol dehydrogenase family)